MSELHVRPARTDEAHEINALVAAGRSTAYYNQSLGLDEQWAQELVEELLSAPEVADCRANIADAIEHPAGRVYGVVGANPLMGVVHAEKRTHEQEVIRLFVRDGVRGQKIGSLMMDAYFEWSDPNLSHVVGVVPYNHGAIRFYEQYGYHIVPGSSRTYPDKVTVIQMRKAAEETQ